MTLCTWMRVVIYFGACKDFQGKLIFRELLSPIALMVDKMAECMKIIPATIWRYRTIKVTHKWVKHGTPCFWVPWTNHMCAETKGNDQICLRKTCFEEQMSSHVIHMQGTESYPFVKKINKWSIWVTLGLKIVIISWEAKNEIVSPALGDELRSE